MLPGLLQNNINSLSYDDCIKGHYTEDGLNFRLIFRKSHILPRPVLERVQLQFPREKYRRRQSCTEEQPVGWAGDGHWSRWGSVSLLCGLHLRPGPVEADCAGDDDLVRGEGGEEEIGGGGAGLHLHNDNDDHNDNDGNDGLHPKSDPLEEVMDAECEHDQESPGCRLKSLWIINTYRYKCFQQHIYQHR